MKNQRGSQLIEFTIGFGFVFLLTVFLALPALYFMTAKVWVRFQLHQALLCTLEVENTLYCKTQLQDKLQRLLPYGNYESLWLRQYSYKVAGRVELTITDHLRVIEGMTLRNEKIRGAL